MLKKIINNPDFFLMSVWLLTVSLYQFFTNTFPSINMLVYFHLCVFILIFSFWFRLSSIFFSKLEITNLKPFIRKELFFTLAASLAFFSLGKAFYLFFQGNLETFMSFRSIISGGSGEEKQSLSVGISFPAVLTAFILARHQNSKFLTNFFLFLCFLISIISTSKIFILILIIVLINSNINRVLNIFLIGLIFLLLFGLSHLLLAKFSSDPEAGIFGALFDTFFVYFLGGLGAYSQMIEGNVQLDPLVTFSALKPLIEIFMATNIPSDPILPWVQIGNWNTNNYSAFGYWYALLGDFHIFFIPIFLGIYYGIFFNKYFVTSSSFELYRIFLIFCLLFTLWGDQFIPAYKMHISYLFFSILFSLTKIQRNY